MNPISTFTCYYNKSASLFGFVWSLSICMQSRSRRRKLIRFIYVLTVILWCLLIFWLFDVRAKSISTEIEWLKGIARAKVVVFSSLSFSLALLFFCTVGLAQCIIFLCFFFHSIGILISDLLQKWNLLGDENLFGLCHRTTLIHLLQLMWSSHRLAELSLASAR